MRTYLRSITIGLCVLSFALFLGAPILFPGEPMNTVTPESSASEPEVPQSGDTTDMFDSPGSYVPPPSEFRIPELIDNKLDNNFPTSGQIQASPVPSDLILPEAVPFIDDSLDNSFPASGVIQMNFEGPQICCQCKDRVLPEQEYYDLTQFKCSQCKGTVVEAAFCNTTCCKYGDTYFLKPEGSCSEEYVVDRHLCDSETMQVCCQTRDTLRLEWKQRQFCDPRYALEVSDTACEEAYRQICCETDTDQAQSTTVQQCNSLHGTEVETATCADLESLVCCSYSRKDASDTSEIMQKQDCFEKDGYIEASDHACNWINTYMCCDTVHNYSINMFRGDCIDEGGTPTNAERCHEIYCCSLGNNRYNRYTSATCVLRQKGTIVEEHLCTQASERICCKVDDRYMYINRQRCRGDEVPKQECVDHRAPDYWSIYY